VVSRQELAVFEAHPQQVQAVVFAPDGKTLATCSGDKTIKLWKVSELGKPKGN
jgi:WD40 repeat protein